MKITTTTILIIMLSAFLFSSCTGTKKAHCGCPNERGLSGYR